MKKPNVCVLDGDIIAYKAAAWADVEGVDELQDRLNEDIKRWTPENCDKVFVAFSCSRGDNYRRKVYPSYKLHREEQPKPDCLGYAKEIVFESSQIKYYDHIEADDILGIAASSGAAIAVTIDKDLNSVPGWHYNPDKDEEPRYISEQEADEFFALQIVTGDSTDGLPGLPKKGKTFFEKEIKYFDQEDWIQEIFWQYQEKGYDLEYLLSQARCVRILRDGEFDKTTGEINLWTPELI